MTNKAIVVLACATTFMACGGKDAPSSPVAATAVSADGARGTASALTISGFVMDTAFRPLPGAIVEVVDGPHAGASATVDAAGEFSLTGTFDPTTQFRASKDGHGSGTRTWQCSVSSCSQVGGARPWLGFYLGELTPPVQIGGNYTVTFTADSTCSDLPSEALVLRYPASISPTPSGSGPSSDTAVTVALARAEFLPGWDRFEIGIAGHYLGFWLYGGHNPAFVEQIAANTYVGVSGVAGVSIAASNPSTVSVSLDGWVEDRVTSAPMTQAYRCDVNVVTRIRCESQNHQLVMTRR